MRLGVEKAAAGLRLRLDDSHREVRSSKKVRCRLQHCCYGIVARDAFLGVIAVVTCRRNLFDWRGMRSMLRPNGPRSSAPVTGARRWLSGAMERFCDELRWERERRKVSIETICEETKVSSRHLHALEAGEYGQLPGGVFRKGIVRSYLGALGLDEEAWIERFEASLRESGAASADANDWTEFAENVRRNRIGTESATGMRWMGVGIMLVSLVALGWGVWKFALHGRLF